MTDLRTAFFQNAYEQGREANASEPVPSKMDAPKITISYDKQAS